MIGEDPGSSVTCVIKSVCVGTEVLWGDRVNSCVHVWRGRVCT